jgi:hypothetical protein
MLDRIARLRAKHGGTPAIPHNEKAEQREMPL